jgi:hypothetical protein
LPYQVTVPAEYVSVRVHGSVGRLAASAQKTYLSRELFDGRRRIDIALLSPASARL